MNDNVIDINSFRNKQQVQQKQPQNEKREITLEERHEKIKQSIQRINGLLAQLQEVNQKRNS